MTLEEEEEKIHDVYTNKGYVSTPVRSRLRKLWSTSKDTINVPRHATPESRSALQPENDVEGSRHHSEAEELYSRFDMSFSRRAEARMSRTQARRNHRGKPVHGLLVPASMTSSPGSLQSVPATYGGESVIPAGSSETSMLGSVEKTANMQSSESSGTLCRSSGRAECSDLCNACGPPGQNPVTESADEVNVTGDSTKIHVENNESPSITVQKSRRGRRMLIDQLKPCTLVTDTCSSASQTDPPHWTYRSSQLLYPILDIPITERRIVTVKTTDGAECDAEVYVKVPRERKRLFMFPNATKKD